MRLQVRQFALSPCQLNGSEIVVRGQPGPWTDVQSGDWLIGFVLPGMGYEFRQVKS